MSRFRLATFACLAVLTGVVIGGGAAARSMSAVVTPPVATTGAVSAVGVASFTGSGTIDDSGLATTYHFDYWISVRSVQRTAETALPRVSGPQAVAAGIDGLTPGTTYMYRLVATNGHGTSAGAPVQFTTLNAPAPPPVPPPPPAKTCRLTNLVGHTLRGALRMLRQHRCGRVVTRHSAGVQRRLVVTYQFPRAGTRIEPSKVVRLRYRRRGLR